jgi:hypothetical protein
MALPILMNDGSILIERQLRRVAAYARPRIRRICVRTGSVLRSVTSVLVRCESARGPDADRHAKHLKS